MIVFPIVIKKCLWKVVPWLKNMQLYPKQGKALEEFDVTEQEGQLMDIINEISNLFD